MNKYYVCKCFFSRNFYVSKYGLHVVYEGKDRFLQQHANVLKEHGCISSDQVELVLDELQQELFRRKNIGNENAKRRQLIYENYQPKHPHIYILQESMLAREFLDLVRYCRTDDACQEDLVAMVTSQPAGHVYSLPVFTESFCDQMIEELEHFEATDLPKGRPNTMNHYGVQLDELGFDEGFITPLRDNYLAPLTTLLYPEWGGACLDSSKAFVVKYKINEDTSLGYHYDNAEVTINISLGKNFTGGDLYFGGLRTMQSSQTEHILCKHIVTHGFLHRGQHMHGASTIRDGERYNLIIWMRSSAVRNHACPMCDRKPELVETVGCGDGFTPSAANVVNVCSVT